MFEVELKQLKGERQTFDAAGQPLARVETKFPRWIIYVQTPERKDQSIPPVEFGYVDEKAGGPILPLPVAEQFGAENCGQIVNLVNAALHRQGLPAGRRMGGLFGAFEQVEDGDVDELEEADE